jgi:hypothetical protein
LRIDEIHLSIAQDSLDGDIRILQTQQIEKRHLRGVFREFANLDSEAPSDIKQRLLNVVIEELRCFVNRGEKTGEIVYRMKRNRTVKEKWDTAKQHEK